MSAGLTLYRKNGACSFAAHALLNHLGVPFNEIELVMTDAGMAAADGSFSNTDYKKIHPDGYVPVLRIDDYNLTELPAVLSYIASLRPDRGLQGSSPLDRAKVDQWAIWSSGKLHAQGFAMLWRPQRFSSDPSMFERIKAHGRCVILDCAARVERNIQGPNAIGTAFTLVDLILYTFYRWISLTVLPNGGAHETFPRYAALARGVERLESIRRTLQIEKQSFLFQS